MGIKKRIWVDVLTPKQALFTKAMIERSPSNVELSVTTRDYAELNKVLRRLKLKHFSFGRHGGAAVEKKLEASIERMRVLLPFVKRNNFDCSLSFISPEAARVSFGLGLKHFICSDSPHAVSPSRLSVPLASNLFTPFPIKKERWTQYGIRPAEISSYHALDPWAWLFGKIGLDNTKRSGSSSSIVLVRLEESFASYAKAGKGLSDVLRELILAIRSQGDFEIMIIPRYDAQRSWANKKFGKTCTVPDTPVRGVDLISKADLVIGGGGTMTQEAALMGIPNISYFPSARLDVFENYYFPKELSVRASEQSELVKQTKSMLLNIEALKDQFLARARKAVRTFEDPVNFLFKQILRD